MVIDESSRHGMFSRLQEVLGKEHAAVLMEHLPPVGWADVATKRDLEATENKLIAAFRGELNAVYREINAAVRSLTYTVLTAVVTVAGLAFAAARLV